MNVRTNSQENEHEGFHFLARGIGVLAIITVLLYLRALFLGGFLNVSIQSQLNGNILSGLLLLGTAGLLIAWRWPRLGGLMAVIFSIPVAWFVSAALDEGDLFAAFIYGSPLLIAGLLFFFDGRYRKQTR
jgi:hypothetical protein